eukprot:Nk52_evm29s805 gene=Nk52_evmTU29s805
MQANQVDVCFYDRDEYIETASGNKVAKSSVLCGSQNIIVGGRSIIREKCVIRGDLSSVRIGKCCLFGEGTVIRPSFKRYKGKIAFFPIQIGDYTFVEKNCILNCASIGSYCYIEEGAIIGKRAVVKDCCVIKAGTVVPPDTVVAPFSYFQGMKYNDHWSGRKDLSSMATEENSLALDESVREEGKGGALEGLVLERKGPSLNDIGDQEEDKFLLGVNAMPECTAELMIALCKQKYEKFQPKYDY